MAGIIQAGIGEFANVWLETTGNNWIGYSSNSITISVANGANYLTINSTGLAVNNFSVLNANSILIGNNYISPFPTFRNKVINGDMRIDQRNSGAVQANVASSSYLVDRFVYSSTVANHINSQQNANASVSAPNGFTNYLGLTVSNAYPTLSNTDNFVLVHRFEGYNVSDLAWGTASAQTVTLSFYTYSNITNTNFGGSLINSGGVGANQ